MFTKQPVIRIVIITLAVFMLSACAAQPTQDVSQLSTQIAAVIYTELTSTAMAMPTATPTLGVTPTPLALLPSPTATSAIPTPTVAIAPPNPPNVSDDNAKFIGDINFPDGTVVEKGDVFEKTWKFENTGTTTWTEAYTLRFLEGNLFGDDSITFVYLPGNVAPGKTVEISVPFRAPQVAGSFNSLWKLYTPDGLPFGEYATINIVVK